MNIAEAKDQIKDTVDAYLAIDDAGAYIIPVQAQRPIFLLGAPGIGKTAIVSQVAEELGIGLVSYSMTHHTRQSALGLPFIVERSYGDESFQVSEYTMSEIIAAIYDYMEKTGHTRGILFLDEINCVSETLYPSMLQFLQFKTFGRHRVPEGWVVACAGNPPEYNKSVYDFDVVTLDRLRKLDVEPDLAAWMGYARHTRVHPAVMSYLEIKESHFYSVESTPSGKAFVTARAWDDLSRVIKLYESRGKVVNRTLIEQFLQDEDIALRFSQYYQLFQKYRADYQIASILSGEASDELRSRALAARFDERLALVRLIADGLESNLSSALEHERVTAIVRDELRDAKQRILDGCTVEECIGARSSEMLESARKSVQHEIASDAKLRPQRLAAARLRELAGLCAKERALEGADGFATLQNHYKSDVENLRVQVESASEQIEHAFAFLEAAFGDDREMTAFVAELTGRTSTSRFISQFGSDAYYAHNCGVLADKGRCDLNKRIDALDLDAAREAAQAQEQAKEAGCTTCGSACC